MGEADDFKMYSFIMARCCNYCRRLSEATWVLVGYNSTLTWSYCSWYC